jgi:hypothetical protein
MGEDGVMTAASFKDLCVDANDVAAQARFWAAVLDARVVDAGDGGARLEPGAGRSPAETVWVNPVPEPRTAKTRVHVDMRITGSEPAAILAAGATVLSRPGENRWWVLADPEGNAFCAFPPDPDEPATPGVFELIVDCRDAAAQATWWAGIVGGTVHRAEHKPFAWIEGAAGFPWRYWVFDPVPEPKTVKNRAHWDVSLTGTRPDALLDAGATLLREPDGEISWWVLADPEGNEFCAFAPAA